MAPNEIFIQTQRACVERQLHEHVIRSKLEKRFSFLYSTQFSNGSMTLLTSTSRHQNLNNSLIPALAGMRQRSRSVGIGKVDVSTSFHKETDGLRMPRCAVAENDGFQQRSPTKVVDVVNFDVSFQQLLNNFNVTTISRAY